MRRITTYIRDFRDIIFPNTCEVCGETLIGNEEVICLNCYADIPRTHTHRDTFGAVHQRLASTIPIDKATSFYYYYKNNAYARIIQKAKYNGLPRYARFLGKSFASEIISDNFFDNIDYLVPIPLSKAKLLKRGYNQSEEIAKGISDITGLPIITAVKSRRHSTQTAKRAYARWLNTRQIFHFTGDLAQIANKHLLIIDDVITTGATILSCCEAIHTASPSTKLSVLSIGLTHD